MREAHSALLTVTSDFQPRLSSAGASLLLVILSVPLLQNFCNIDAFACTLILAPGARRRVRGRLSWFLKAARNSSPFDTRTSFCGLTELIMQKMTSRANQPTAVGPGPLKRTPPMAPITHNIILCLSVSTMAGRILSVGRYWGPSWQRHMGRKGRAHLLPSVQPILVLLRGALRCPSSIISFCMCIYGSPWLRLLASKGTAAHGAAVVFSRSTEPSVPWPQPTSSP